MSGSVYREGDTLRLQVHLTDVDSRRLVREVPIVFEDRRVGQSKMSRKIFVEALTMVWKLRLTV